MSDDNFQAELDALNDGDAKGTAEGEASAQAASVAAAEAAEAEGYTLDEQKYSEAFSVPLAQARIELAKKSDKDAERKPEPAAAAPVATTTAPEPEPEPTTPKVVKEGQQEPVAADGDESYDPQTKEWQVKTLRSKLNALAVSHRESGFGDSSSTVPYLEGWLVIDTLNRIFGFDRWGTALVKLEKTAPAYQYPQMYYDRTAKKRVPSIDKDTGEPKQLWSAGAMCAIELAVEFVDGNIVRKTGIGNGTGANANPHEAQSSADKEAATDALKRAAIHLGNKYGLALYDKQFRGVEGTVRPS